MIWAASVTMKRFCVAAELNVRFLKRVAVGQQLLWSPRLGRQSRPPLGIERQNRCAMTAGVIYARGASKQVPMNLADMKLMIEDFLPAPDTVALPPCSSLIWFPELQSGCEAAGS